MYKLPPTLVLMSALYLCYSCAQRSSAPTTMEKEDSIEAAKPGPTILKRLPDTLYDSASGVKYNIEIFDSLNGRLNGLNDMYEHVPGVFTFRGNAFRNGAPVGTVKGCPSEFIVNWTFRTARDTTKTKYGVWGGGTGWTGQPVYISWPDSCLNSLKKNGAVFSDFTGQEIIVGSLCSLIYFIDFSTGKASRRPIAAGNPIKGTVSLDPTLNGHLYVGQGIPARKPFGALVINLFTNKQIDFFDEDKNAYKYWGAYDSSPLRAGQFLFRPAENGSIYKYKVLPTGLELHSVLRYKVNGMVPGMESSMSVYSNYGYIADNYGHLLAINLDNMKPVWLYSFGDDTDATPVIEIEKNRPVLYLGCEIQRISGGYARFAKIDGINGKEIWHTDIEGQRIDVGEKHFDGGYYSSALPGMGDCEKYIFINCVKNTRGQNGALIAFDKETGKIAFETPLKRYAWSSPVGFVNEKNIMYIVTGDCYGNLYLIKGSSGEIITSQRIGYNFESTPVVVDNSLVVGSRGDCIYKISLK